MSRIPMPSPRGTNHEGLFLTGKAAAAVKGGAAYDAAMEDGPSDKSALTDSDGSPIADSSQAHRILSACIDRLNKSDMGKVCAMLKEADMLSDDEVRAINAGMEGDGGGGEMASDAALRRERHRLVAIGKLPASALHAPLRAPSAEANRSFNERFPMAARIKHV